MTAPGLFGFAGGQGDDYPPGILPVQYKNALAMARDGSLIHRIRLAGAALDGSALKYAARWMCGRGSQDVILLPVGTEPGRLCWRCANPPEIGVYRCFGKDGLLYLGSTVDLADRLRGHARKSAWWPEVTEVKCTPFATIDAARATEALAIAAEMPRYNRHGRRTASELASAALRVTVTAA